MFKIKPSSVNVIKMGEPVTIGKWRKVKELGSGGFGTVSLWVNNVTSESLAIKKCKWNLETHLSQKQKDRWCSEVKMIRTIINHKNIVGYRNIPEELETTLLSYNPSNLPILSMEYCSLGNLRSVLCSPENCCGLPETEVVQILKDISSALSYLHNLQITHRDVKPENIVLQMSDTNKSAVCYKLIDLGYAKELNSQTISFVGTLQYLAPEILSQQLYNPSVDYWSLGITAFEIATGMRPFLPTFTAVQCYKNLELKESDVICIQFTHVGDIKSTKKLPKENHLNACLIRDMEIWLKSVLEFDPQRRGVIDNNNVKVFEYLGEILSKKIITVFSVYTYEFYSYEVNESTLFSTLQDWIARDLKIHKSDQYLIATNNSCNSNYAKDYFDENNPEAMLFAFKRSDSISRNIQNILPKLITTMFQNMKTPFKCGTLKLLHAQMIYYILHEMKHYNCLNHSIIHATDLLRNLVTQERDLSTKLKTSLKEFLSEIEFYNHIERSSLYNKVNENTNSQIESILLKYKNCMCQMNEIIDIINGLSNRLHSLIIKHNKLQLARNVLLDKLGNYDFSSLIIKAKDCYNNFLETTPNKVLTGGPYILQIISATIKIRDKLLNDTTLLPFIKVTSSCLSELSKLKSCREGVEIQISAIKNQLREIVIERLAQNLHDNNDNYKTKLHNNDNANLIKTNSTLRYKLLEYMNMSLVKYKEITNTNEILSTFLQNGEQI